MQTVSILMRRLIWIYPVCTGICWFVGLKGLFIDLTCYLRFSGWFEVLPENGQPIEYFDTINAIVGIRPKQFLVRTSIVGYQLTVENGISSWMPWEIRPGEVLTTGIVQMDQKKSKKKPFFKRLFSSGKAGSKKEQELKYLQCFDIENREIMIPLIMTGVFSPVGDSASTNFDAVYTLRDLITAFTLPIKAQLIHTDSNTYDGIPSGVLTLNNLKDKETLLVTTCPNKDGESATFEIPVIDDVTIVREKKRKPNKRSPTDTSEFTYEDDSVVFSNQIDLPIRVKDSKRTKGSGILEKFSVRSKGRKERASLKALQEAGVFSSRLSKTEINFGDCDKDSSESQTEDNDTNENKCISSPVPSNDVSYHRNSQEVDTIPAYAKVVKRNSLRDRDLPPIPDKTRSPRNNRSPEKENHYEELPMAPRPPNGRLKNETFSTETHENDGYMTPAQLRQLKDDNDAIDFEVVKRKPPTAPKPDSLRLTRMRRVRSEFSPLSANESENIDNMFDFSYAEQEAADGFYDRRRQLVGYSTPVRRAPPPDDFNPNYRQRMSMDDDPRRFNDDSALEPKILSGFSKLKSRSHKSLLESNATIRSHNVRKMRTAMEVFNFSDSLRDLRQPIQNSDMPTEPTYGRVIDNERVKSYIYGTRATGQYSYTESEPPYRKYHRTPSTAALSDSFPKHGDDSAISMCSRGEYGFNGESEYSYSEYSEWQDDGWQPPEDIGNLSVLEVSKSLRYIGMKDRVVIRFANEQIDGDMLCSLDKKLLQEGFPELNALEIKKILDFVRGWRPKK